MQVIAKLYLNQIEFDKFQEMLVGYVVLEGF